MSNGLRVILMVTVFGVLSPTGTAEDATKHVPSEFQSDIYIEQDTEDFCNTQNSPRPCIEVTIKNRSHATLDLNMDTVSGSATGSGALDGFQVFEVPGCIHVANLPYVTKRSMNDHDVFTRRMREEKLHYWKSGTDKTIKVLQGCTYAIAIKREDGDKNWHVSYVPPAAKDGCTLEYRYVTSKAKLKEYEKWATFGAIGGAALTAVGSLGTGGAIAYSVYSSETTYAAAAYEVGGFTAPGAILEDSLAEGVLASGAAAVVLVSVVAVYEAGVWGVFGVDSLVRVIDGKRDFVLGKNCY